MAAKSVLICLMIAGCVFAELPEYIHVCHRKDPEVSKCIIQSVEVLRPRLRVGIPELDVPAIEPLNLPQLVISRGTSNNFRAIGNNVFVHGLSYFQVTKLKLDIPNTTFYIGLKFDNLRFLADVDVNIRLLVVPVKGEGNLIANATNCIGNVILKGELVTENGVERMHFSAVDLDLSIDDIEVKIDNIFGGDKALGEAVNSALHENRKQIFGVIKPIAEKTVSDLLLELINNIVTHFAYDEVFPE